VRKARNKSTNGGRQPIWNQSAFNLGDFQISGQDILDILSRISAD